jgi:hypothetical protein
MKNVILSLFLILGFGVLSQINCDSISYYMFEMHNVERTNNGSSKRYLSSNCKKASEIHLNYLMKYGFELRHTEDKIIYGKKVLSKPVDRYNLFNSDSVLSKKYEGFYVKKPVWVFMSEIATRQQINYGLNDLVSNKEVAIRLIQNFKNSSAHYSSMVENVGEYISRGNFIVNYTTSIENGLVKHTFYCVAIFETGYYLKDKSPYKEDYTKIY